MSNNPKKLKHLLFINKNLSKTSVRSVRKYKQTRELIENNNNENTIHQNQRPSTIVL